MNEALAYSRLASRLLRSIRAVEADTSEYDDTTTEILGLILGAFGDVSDLVEARLAGTPATAIVTDTEEEDDDDQIN